MNRREFLWSAALIGSVGARLNGSRFGMPTIGRARLSAERPAPLPQSLTADGWRIFEITTHVHVQNASGVTRAWLPTPLVGGVYQQTLGDTYHAEGGTVLMVDPADVRKVALEEPPGILPIGHEKVRDARARLFGSWEMNWIGFNSAHDVVLPRSNAKSIGYFMYPQAETSNGRADGLDPDTFRYDIVVREIG